VIRRKPSCFFFPHFPALELPLRPTPEPSLRSPTRRLRAPLLERRSLSPSLCTPSVVRRLRASLVHSFFGLEEFFLIIRAESMLGAPLLLRDFAFRYLGNVDGLPSRSRRSVAPTPSLLAYGGCRSCNFLPLPQFHLHRSSHRSDALPSPLFSAAPSSGPMTACWWALPGLFADPLLFPSHHTRVLVSPFFSDSLGRFAS